MGTSDTAPPRRRRSSAAPRTVTAEGVAHVGQTPRRRSPRDRASWLVSAGRADPDPDEPLVAGTHLAPGIRRAEHELSGPHRDLLAVDHDRPAAGDDRVHLFLAVGDVVVLRPLPTRRKLEPVDLELADSERRAQPAKHAVRRLD